MRRDELIEIVAILDLFTIENSGFQILKLNRRVVLGAITDPLRCGW